MLPRNRAAALRSSERVFGEYENYFFKEHIESCSENCHYDFSPDAIGMFLFP